MIKEIINMREDNPQVTLTAYTSADDKGTNKREAILICPGGSYYYCADHEGEKIALKYAAEGFAAFVLNYSTKSNNPDMKHPMPLVDASNGMKYIKDNAEKYRVDKDRVFVCGFSAGGHLASTLGTIWHRAEVYQEAEEMEFGYNKPRGMILCYPVIHPKGHMGSFKTLLDEDADDPEKAASLASHLNVDKNTCPAFIWHTADDISVNAESSFDMALALKRAGIKFELHIYPNGGHGLGFPDGENGGPLYPDVMTWFKRSVDWIRSN